MRSRLGSLTAVDCAHGHDTAQDSDSQSRHGEKRRGRSENGQSGNRPEGGNVETLFYPAMLYSLG